MSDNRPPEFRELGREEIDAVMSANELGRLAYTIHDRVDIEPINYVYQDGWIFGRTSLGAKLNDLAHRPWVAFEVDEVSAPFAWRSVVVRGSFHRLHEDGSPSERESYARAVAALRTRFPETLTDDDPVPFRTEVFGIHVDEARGRAAE
jgi:nitroimidazol reductase NimA-like FMN-containing flavoprotein (pyridoxamine 5'-phosphate oxidase superfamily)